MFIILDSNEWDRMPMLRHALAAPLLFAIQQRPGVRIGLPSVVRGEVELHLVEKAQQAQVQQKRASGVIRQILGEARQVEEISDEQVRQAFAQRLTELGGLVEVLEPTEGELSEAGRMVLRYLPPSTRESQQYRDSVIWRIAMRMGADSDVYLVTSDGGFYADKDSDRLAESLAYEARENRCSIRLFRSVKALLLEWSSSRPDLKAELHEPIADAVQGALTDFLAQQGEFAPEGLREAEFDVFLTEAHDQVTAIGRFEYHLSETNKPGGFRSSARAIVSATATVGSGDHKVRDVELETVQVDMLTAEGTRLRSQGIFGKAAIGISSQPYKLTVNYDQKWPGSS